MYVRDELHAPAISCRY